MNIHDTAGDGNVPAMRKLLAAGTSVDARDETGNTPLMLAALGGSLKAFQTLCEAGADPHARNANGYTALHFAAQANQPEMVRALLEAGLGPDELTAKKSTPLMIAAAAKAAKAVAVLLEKGARADAANAQGKTALQLAKSINATGIVKLLKDAGAERAQPEIPPSDKKLWNAAAAGNVSKIRALLAAGASPNVTLDRGESALMRAVVFGHLDAALALLEAGAEPHARNVEGDNLLHDAAFGGNAELVRTFLQKGLHVNATNNCGFTPLMAAAMTDHVDIVQMLLKAGADANVRGNFADHRNKTALEMICTEDRKIRKALTALLTGADAPPDPIDDAYQEVENFAKSAKKRAFKDILTLLGDVCAKPPKPWTKCPGAYQCAGLHTDRLIARNSTNKYLRNALRAADADGQAALLLEWLQGEVYASGLLLVQADLTDEPATVKLLAFPMDDKYAVLAALGTDGANYGHDTRAIIAWLLEMEKKNRFNLTACGSDFVAGKFHDKVANAHGLAERMVEFCPDLIDGDMVASAADVARDMTERQEFCLRWG
jgi:ankyrin repeat protein